MFFFFRNPVDATGYAGSISQTQAGSCVIADGDTDCTAQAEFTVVTRNPEGVETFNWTSPTVGVNIISGQGTKTITTETTSSSNTPYTVEVECNDTITTINKSKNALDTRTHGEESLMLLANGTDFLLLSDNVSILKIRG